MTHQEITKIIDIVWQGVENSKAGKILEDKQIFSVGYQTFLTVLAAVCPKSDIKVEASGGMEIKEPKENWEIKEDKE